MRNNGSSHLSRRDFLKGSLAGAAAFGVAPTLFIPRAAPVFAATEGPHPNINGLHVVGIHDPKMTSEELLRSPWREQERLVNEAIVAENMDKLACSLSGEKSVKDAWKAIFLKPPEKSWGDVVVAIKTNNIAEQHTHSAVMARFCEVFVKELGVKASHVLIYDACHGKDMLKKTPFESLPEECRVLGKWDSYVAETPIPKPWKSGAEKSLCIPALVKGEVDILVNIALCKGHFPTYGSFTMSMKNHLGTFRPKPAHEEGGTDYLFAINKTPEILGEIGKNGKVLFPRQQLCFIDCLWASEQGPMGHPSAQPNRLFMGTHSPVLDYLVATEFRRDLMKWPIKDQNADRFLSEFDLRKSDLKKIVQV